MGSVRKGAAGFERNAQDVTVLGGKFKMGKSLAEK
jgi:hypothetical protein